MDAKQKHQIVKLFVERWTNKGDEKQDTHNFWHDLLHSIFEVDNPSTVIEFEKRVHLGHTSYIDGYIKSSKVLIEQKGQKIELNEKEKQSDGSFLSPYEQAFRYAGALPLDSKPKYIVTCNFKTFQIYDQNVEDPLNQTPIVIELKDLPKDYTSLSFLTDLKAVARKAELEVSVRAGDLIGKLYDALLKQYGEGADQDDERLKSLNKLCVRLVFCLYAEDADLFPIKNQFGDFLKSFAVENIDTALEKLFHVLNTKFEDRKPSLQDKFKAFPYVNGGLFADDDSEIPPFNEEVAKILIEECSDGFDWSKISPTIFGAIFESTLNPATRRQGGMHYTSIENIHKVIDPLFLDELRAEFANIMNDDETRYNKKGREKLSAFQDKLASLKFLDPACGSGNFLTETFICLRRLENEVILHLGGGSSDLFSGIEGASPVKVNLNQFYGIEINDFAATVAKTALWIAESQLLQETERIVGHSINFLPLKTYSNIVEGNALRMDWNDVVPASELNFIMGNPPFVGFYLQTKEQKLDVENITGKKSLDLVSCWFLISAQYMQSTIIKCAFVSTNSITQGEQVALMWDRLLYNYNVNIIFAYKTFNWNSEATDKAHVHCVIVGFSCFDFNYKKTIYLNDGSFKIVRNITPYLTEGNTVLIKSLTKPICSDARKLELGNRPLDGQNLLLTQDEYQQLIQLEPESQKWIRPFLGATEFINNKKRYCLWLVGISPNELNLLPLVKQRVYACKKARENAKDKQMKKLAETPTLFREQKTGTNEYIVVPRVSSSNRKYCPIGFVSREVIVGDALQAIFDSDLYIFGILNSITHNAWLRAVGGRLKSDYRYGKETVYNTFTWPEVNDVQRKKISKTAQAILDARALYPDSSLADLYDPLTMPVELKKAHKANDKAVIAAYGWDKDITEEKIVANLMYMYAKKIAEKETR